MLLAKKTASRRYQLINININISLNIFQDSRGLDWSGEVGEKVSLPCSDVDDTLSQIKIKY